MAGTLVADTLQNGVGTSTSMTNAITGSCKAWVEYNGSTQTILNSYNVSSVTYAGTGQYQVNFTNAMPSSSYANIIASNTGSNVYIRNDAGQTSTYTGMSFFDGSSYVNIARASLAVFSN